MTYLLLVMIKQMRDVTYLKVLLLMTNELLRFACLVSFFNIHGFLAKKWFSFSTPWKFSAPFELNRTCFTKVWFQLNRNRKR